MQKSILPILMLILFMYACSKKNSSPDTSVQPKSNDFSSYALTGLDSPFISKDTANLMLESYLSSCPAGDIKAFIIDADALRYYLNNTNIKHMKLMFAHKLSYIRAGNGGRACGFDPNALTIVISAFDGDNNYIYTPQGAVMDFSQPCPTKCVVDGTAANDKFPTN